MKARWFGQFASSLALVVGLSSACGGSKAPPEEPTPTGEEPLPEPPPPAPEPTEPTGEAPGPADPPGKEGDPDVRVREITRRECRALAGKYAELTRSDETAKLNPKLTGAQKDQAGVSINAAAEKLEAGWVESCEANLVGKVAEEQSIMCAMNSRNVAAFDSCLNGPK